MRLLKARIFGTPLLSVMFWGAAAAAKIDLPLEVAIERALTANRGVISSSLLRNAQALSVSAAESEFDWKVVPTSMLGRSVNGPVSTDASIQNLSLGAQLTKKLDWGTVVAIGPSYNRYGSASNTTLNGSVRQPLLAGFGSGPAFDAVRRAQHALSAAERSHHQARITLALETVTAYYSALRERKLEEMNEALSERLRRHVAIAQSKERSGLTGSSDTLRAQIRMKDSEDAVQRSRAAFELETDRLRHLLALPPDTELRLQAAIPPPFSTQNAEHLSLENSAELEQLRDDYEEARRGASLAANAALPDISVNVSYGQVALADPALQSFVPSTQRQWNVFVQASGDLARTSEKLGYRRAVMRVDSLEASIDDKRAGVRRAVRQQLRAIDTARLRIELRVQQIDQAVGRLALAEVKFAHDMADNFELMEAETDLQHARHELESATTEHALGIYAFLAMTGQFPR